MLISFSESRFGIALRCLGEGLSVMIVHHHQFAGRVCHVTKDEFWCRDGATPIGHCRESGFRYPCDSCSLYQLGHKDPHYPVPSLIGEVMVRPEAVVIAQPNEMTRSDPYLTYWNESWGLPLPSDHGICNPDRPE